MHTLVDSLHDIYPLIIGAGVALAFTELIVKQSKPERIPPIARKVNEFGIAAVPLMAIVVVFVALQYSFTQQNLSLFSISYALLWFAYLVLIMAFLVPIVFTIPPFWRKSFYSQFEAAQSKDVLEAEEARRRMQDAEQSTTE